MPNNRLQLLILFLLLLTIANTGNTQQYNFKSTSVEEGLPRSGAYSLLQDTKGYLWVTLDGGGVARYDGKNFTTLDLENGLPSRKVRAIYEDSQQNIWFGTTKGLSLYKNNKLQSFTTENGLPHNYVRSITEDSEGRLVIGTNNGVCFLENGKINQALEIQDTLFDLKIRVLYKDRNKKIWIGTEEGLYFINYENKIQQSNLNSKLPNQTILSIENDSKGNIWVGTENGVLKSKDSNSTIYNSSTGIISDRVRAICEDKVGNIWIGTRLGVSCITKDNILNFNKENGLSHDRIRDILLDNNGTIWFATYYGGINSFNPRDFITYTTKEGLVSDQYFTFSQSKTTHKIAAGSFDGLSTFKFKNGLITNIKNYTEIDGLPDNRIYTLFEDSNKYTWIGTKKGIALTKDFKSFTPLTNKKNNLTSEIYAIIQENENTFWAGGEDGLFQITFSKFPDDFIIIPYENEVTPSTDISSLAKDLNNNIWIGYRHEGIRIKKSNGGFITPRFSKKIQNISTIVIDEHNHFWVGTDAEGLFLIENTRLEDSIKVKQFKKEDGLTSNNIYAVDCKNHSLWLGSEKGVDKISLDSKDNIYSIKNFGKDEGVAGGEIIEKAKLLSKEGFLLLGTVKGIASSSPFNYDHISETPFLRLLKFESFNRRKSIITQHVNDSSQIKIEYSTNNISVDFIGIDLNSPKKVKYKWYLEGFSTNWSKPTKRNFINFTNLTDKDYVLKIISSNSDGIWNTEPLIIKFRVKTPFWKSTWFTIVIILLIALLIFLIVKWKINQLINKQLILEKKILEATRTIEEEKARIEEQSVQIYDQKELLEEQHKEIKQSIDYAQLIQEASLPEKKINELLSDAFLLYKPRDIVSGDFYWWEKKEDYILFCVADSTGHGIPGAFISLIGTILSNEIFHSKKLLFPNQILDELNKSVQLTLEQHLPNPKIKDGMDLSFCCYNKSTKTIFFSGANNPLWIVRHNNQELTLNNKTTKHVYENTENGAKLFEIKGDKQPIGLHAVKQHPFTLNEVNVLEGDELYMFTDGYADQFGGEKDKKFMSKRFKHLLTTNENVPMDKVKTIINLNFVSWKGSNEQVDDVCVVGVRI